MATVCDVTFRVGRTKSTLHGHKTDLVRNSDVFRAMLCGPLAEKGDIDIPDVESHDFNEFLEFLRTGSCDVTHENVTTMLYLAKKYTVSRLEFLCLQFLHQSLSPDNASVVMEHAHIFNERHLYEEAFKVVVENFLTIGDGICNLCSDCLRKVITKCALKATPLFNAAILWADAECRRQGREITLKNVMSYIEDYFVMIPVLNLNRSDLKTKSKRLLSDDDLENMMSLWQHTGENRFLYKNRKGEEVETVANSLYTSDVILYNTCHPLASVKHVEKSEDGIDFTFDTNVMLMGVYLYKPEGDRARVRLTIQKFLVPVSLEDNEYDVIESADNDSLYVEVCLKQPLPLMQDVRYCMYASMNRRPVHVGDKPRNIVTDGDCTFSRKHQEYVDAVNMVYGFRIGNLVGL